MQVPGLFSRALDGSHLRTIGVPGQGVDASRRCGRIWRPAPRFRAPHVHGPANRHGEDSQKPAQAGNPPGHRRPRHQRPARFRQSGGLSRLDRALSRPPRTRWRTARATNMAAAAPRLRKRWNRRSRRSRVTAVPASPCCRRAWPRSRPRCLRSQAQATTSWSPTASTGRPAISARACSSAWASRPPITIR